MRLAFALTLSAALAAIIPAAAAAPTLSDGVKTIFDAYPGKFVSLRGPVEKKTPAYFEYVGKLVPAGFQKCTVTQNNSAGQNISGYRCTASTGVTPTTKYDEKAAAALSQLYAKTLSTVKQVKPSASLKKYTSVDVTGNGSAAEALIHIPGGPMVTVSTRDVHEQGTKTNIFREVRLEVETPHTLSTTGWQTTK